MNVTGIGSTYNFIYNAKADKLSIKDGSKNEFVDFYNGDVKEEEESAVKTSFYVNGQKAFTAYTGMSYLPYQAPFSRQQ